MITVQQIMIEAEFDAVQRPLKARRLESTIIRHRREALVVTPTHRWVGAMDDDLGPAAWIASLPP